MSDTSRAYQQVIAGRVREDEQISYIYQNKSSLPTGNVITNRVSGGIDNSAPIEAEHLQTDWVGKKRPEDGGGVLENHDGSGNNSSVS